MRKIAILFSICLFMVVSACFLFVSHDNSTPLKSYDKTSTSVTPYLNELSSSITPFESNETLITSPPIKQIEPITWYADLTHDGIDEKIVADLTYVINYPKTGDEKTVSVYSGSTGDLIWSGHADTVHPGWNGIYIYDDGNDQYLLIWTPTMYCDQADYNIKIFSLTETGELKDHFSKSLKFDMNQAYQCDTKAISSYIKKVNSYLEKSYVLIDTDNSIPVYSTSNHKITHTFDASDILTNITELKGNINYVNYQSKYFSIYVPDTWKVNDSHDIVNFEVDGNIIVSIKAGIEFSHDKSPTSMVDYWLGKHAYVKSENEEKEYATFKLKKVLVGWEAYDVVESKKIEPYPDELHYFCISKKSNLFLDINVSKEFFTEEEADKLVDRLTLFQK